MKKTAYIFRAEHEFQVESKGIVWAYTEERAMARVKKEYPNSKWIYIFAIDPLYHGEMGDLVTVQHL
jgi:hypothetical protein